MTHALEPSGSFGASSGVGSPRQNWWWRLEDESGQEVTVEGLSGQGFGSQSDAESWVGEVWQDLLEGGAEAVTLFEAERHVYGPMSLRPAS